MSQQIEEGSENIFPMPEREHYVYSIENQIKAEQERIVDMWDRRNELIHHANLRFPFPILIANEVDMIALEVMEEYGEVLNNPNASIELLRRIEKDFISSIAPDIRSIEDITDVNNASEIP